MIAIRTDGELLSVALNPAAINPLSRLFQRELGALLDQLEARRARPRAVVIGFNPTADATGHELAHLMTLTSAQAGDCMQMLGAYNALLRRLEALETPVLAALSGAVSGHALGLALACHRRLARPDTCLSLPQVRLGLAPVGGAIVRTVRLAGLAAAMPLLTDGATLTVGQAQQIGLLHEVAISAEEMMERIHRVLDKPVRAPAWDDHAVHPPAGAARALLHTAPAQLRQRHGGAAPAAEAILCAMVEGLQVDFETALLIESRYFCQTALHGAFSTKLKSFL